ncbi:DUF6786 family protein [Phycisphaera mikurensis]|uniref:Uncharacterized protein n=1 Tax=Phycisphaera mikurensis (strain NBRC 102666 / KCTC 22515 / FYK2301M01) TaxID=1142394 RepID=I0IG95_PHYMF|nr:DUF6786 family protein [Phycisphaera mikurensis]MBB6440335.1 hypothetical protein [Phycisphaera mikurensis]BAM04283.1 hypothetical protein PSMK_21240 [Phycisphaera mikurensis NBRC 102666]
MHDFDEVAARLRDEKQGGRTLRRGAARLAVCERGARVMAADAGDGSADALYLADDDAGELCGGDRFWLGPEVAWFWPSLQAAREDPVKHAATPPQLDPGRWGVGEADAGSVTLHATMGLTDARDGRKIRLEAERTVRLIDPPPSLSAGVSAVAYAVDHRLTALGGEEGVVASSWSIAQVPPGGTLVCPTVRPLSVADDVTRYYDPFGDDHVKADADAVRFVIDARRRIKMGLRAEDTTGRMGYLRPLGDGRAVLLLRFFPTLPGERYCDVPRSADAGVRGGGDCLQAYNDDLTYGPFGEMEHHDPAVEVGGVENRCHSSTTLVLAGDEAAVRRDGGRLLGATL